MIYFNDPDLHLHSAFSDGTDDPAELLEAVRCSGVDAFALTDHDTMDGCAAIEKLLRKDDPFFIAGIEFSCADERGKYHILGYGCDPAAPCLRDAVAYGHSTRMRKLESRLTFLEQRYGFRFTQGEFEQLCRERNPGKPHIVACLLRKGLIPSSETGYALFDGYTEPEKMLSPEDAVTVILGSGGIPVLAHGILADGSASLTPEETRERISRLFSAGLMGAECFYSGYSERQTEIMLTLSWEAGLLITAGSDYHGSNKAVRIGDTNGADAALLTTFFACLAERRKHGYCSEYC